MPQTEVLLVEHIDNLGSEGDVVKVRPGYARNYLIPRSKAVPLKSCEQEKARCPQSRSGSKGNRRAAKVAGYSCQA